MNWAQSRIDMLECASSSDLCGRTACASRLQRGTAKRKPASKQFVAIAFPED